MASVSVSLLSVSTVVCGQHIGEYTQGALSKAPHHCIISFIVFIVSLTLLFLFAVSYVPHMNPPFLVLLSLSDLY